MIPIIFDNLVDGKYYLCYRSGRLPNNHLCYIFKMRTDKTHALDVYQGMRSWLVDSKDIYGMCKVLNGKHALVIITESDFPAIILSENTLEYFELTEEEILNHIVAEKI